MESPPRTFGTPRKCKRHKSNHYYEAYDSLTTNPSISYSSPPTIHRKRIKHSHSLSSPPRQRRIHSNNISSPLSSRYRHRIGNTSLYENNHNNDDLHPQKRNKKYLSSPISPTFHPINHSPSRTKYKN